MNFFSQTKSIINRAINFCNKHKKIFTVLATVFIFAVVVFGTAHFALAEEVFTGENQSVAPVQTQTVTQANSSMPSATDPSGDPSTSGIGSAIIWGITKLLTWVTGWVLRMIMFVLEFLIQIASYNDYLNSPAVAVGWVLVRDMANMFFVVVLLVIAFGTILGIEQYEYKKMIGKFVMAAVLVNFSHLICGFIIDVSQVFTVTFVNGIAAAAGGNVINAFKLTDIMSFATGTHYTNINDMEIFIAAFAGLIFSVLALATMVGYLAILLARMVYLWILIVLSPLAFVLGIMSQTQKYSGQWWQQFISNVIAAPICVFFLWLCFATIGEGDINATVGKNNPGKMNVDQVNSEGTALPSAGVSGVMNWSNLGSFVIALGMLLGGIKVTIEIGAAGTGAFQKAVDFGKGALKWSAMNMPVVGGKSWINRGLAIKGRGIQLATAYNKGIGKLGEGTSKVLGTVAGGAVGLVNEKAGARVKEAVTSTTGKVAAWGTRQIKFGSQNAYHEEIERANKARENLLGKSIGMAGSRLGIQSSQLEKEVEYRTRGSDAKRKLNGVKFAAEVLLNGEVGTGMIKSEAELGHAQEGLVAEEEKNKLVAQGVSLDDAERQVKALMGEAGKAYSMDTVYEVDEKIQQAESLEEQIRTGQTIDGKDLTPEQIKDFKTKAQNLRNEAANIKLTDEQKAVRDSDKEIKVLESIKKAIEKGDKNQAKAIYDANKDSMSGVKKLNMDLANDQLKEAIKDSSKSVGLNKEKALSEMSKGRQDLLQKNPEYQSLVRKNSALYMADQSAYRDHERTFYRARQQKAIDDAAQRNIWNKQGFTVPTMAMQGVIEEFSKKFKDMNYEQSVAAHRGHLEKLKAKRDSGQEITFEDEAISAAIARKLFDNGWIDDADEAIMAAKKNGSIKEDADENDAEVKKIRKDREENSSLGRGVLRNYDNIMSRAQNESRRGNNNLNNGLTVATRDSLANVLKTMGISGLDLRGAYNNEAEALRNLELSIKRGLEGKQKDPAIEHLCTVLNTDFSKLGSVLKDTLLKVSRYDHSDLVGKLES